MATTRKTRAQRDAELKAAERIARFALVHHQSFETSY